MSAGAGVVESADAGAVVREGVMPPSTTGEFVDGLRDECGFVIGGLFAIVRHLTGHDLLVELLDPIAGDMAAVSSMQAGWVEVGRSAAAIGDNYRSLGAQLPASWEGEAAAAAVVLTGRLAEVHHQQREAADLVAEQLGHVVRVSQATAEVVVAVLQLLDSLVQELLLEAAAGPLGWSKAALSSPGRVRRIISLVARGVAAIEDLTQTVRMAVAALRVVNGLLDVVHVAVRGVEAAADVAVGRRMDDTATAGFDG